MWAYNSVFYQIYPLGLCGAPFLNDGVQTHRINRISQWLTHIKETGADAVYFSPLFESDTHGYNTRDYFKIDSRLGTNEDFKAITKEMHDMGLRVVLDGVFNHVGRGFWAFRDVLEKRWESPYKDWFNINFDGNSNYNDGLWYEGWEGNYDLVKLNLRNEEVVNHIFEAVKFWVDEFDIDGLRLDVAYCLDHDFLRRLRKFTEELKPEFVLIGELLHGDYRQWVNSDMLHSCTNYQCYKGLYSSFNSMNMFEIVHSLNRMFGPEDWCVCRGEHLLNFADNHDVTRIASILTNEKHLPILYGMMFGMPGMPCIYYGSEFGIKGEKSDGDPALRPEIEKPQRTELTEFISKLANAFKNSDALINGSFKPIVLQNKYCIFERKTDNQRVLVAVNASEEPAVCHFDAGCGQAVDLITGKLHDFGGGSELPPYSVAYWDCLTV